MWRRIRLITGREYWSRVRKKSFIITTLVAPLGFVFFFLFVAFVSTMGESEKRVLVIDESGLFDDVVFPSSDDGSVKVEKLDTIFHSGDDLGPLLGEDVTIVIPEGFELMRPERKQISYYTDQNLGMGTRAYLEDILTQALREKQFQVLEISEEEVAQLEAEIQMSGYTRTEESENSAFQAIASGVGFIIGFAIYLALFIYGTMIMRGVMEEKNNRIVEVMASAVKPFELLIGKILGIGAVGLTQFVLWGVMIGTLNLILTAIVGTAVAGGMNGGGGEVEGEIDAAFIQDFTEAMSQLDFLPIFIVFLFFFLGGYLLYGSLYAAVGSATNDDGDIQGLSFPISLPIIASIIIMMPVINDPDGSLAFWASIFPLTSPIIMPARIAFSPPFWQVALSMALLLLTFIASTWIAARIYRIGILMYGKKVKFKELIRWAFSREP
jgi:ABC-2 type transport system permease protein